MENIELELLSLLAVTDHEVSNSSARKVYTIMDHNVESYCLIILVNRYNKCTYKVFSPLFLGLSMHNVGDGCERVPL